MKAIVPELRWSDKEMVLKELQQCVDAAQKIRLLVIVNLIRERGAQPTAAVLQVSRSTVYRVAKRFREQGTEGLLDGRRHNGHRKVTEKYCSLLYEVVKSSPPDHGWQRPTWTRILLVATMLAKTRIRIHVATMSRVLHRLGARRGRPKPTVACPWPESRKRRRLAEIRRLIARLPTDEVAVYEDEVDIHLNPKIGLDWMVQRQQKEVLTPGKNVKRYLAGALDARSRRLMWVEGERKTSELFVRLLWALVRHYRHAKVIHVILDNFKIHTASLVATSLRSAGGKIKLHFLPPYCPDDNPIERNWEDLHANVTRNHRCPTMDRLLENVRSYLIRRNHTLSRQALAA